MMGRTRKPRTAKSMSLAWAKLMEQAKASKDDEKCISEAFNEMLDRLRAMDFFGTEGQIDPRGDCRE